MNITQYWKNFNLGEELQIAGSFLYNSLYHLSGMRNFQKDYECFEVLYNASVGIERLQKICIILIEHTEVQNQEKFEQELITHDHFKLMQRIKESMKIKLGPDLNKFLLLLKDFYALNRYKRFKLSSVTDTNDERLMLSSFIGSGLKIPINYEGFYPDLITNQMRRYYGKALIKLSDILFNLIKKKATSLGIFTFEVESSSKAYRVFLQKEITFESELNFKREILIYLLANANVDSALAYLKQIKPLHLDGSTADYIEFLLNSSKDPSIIDELLTRYEDLTAKEIKERKETLEVIGENLAYIDLDDESDII